MTTIVESTFVMKQSASTATAGYRRKLCTWSKPLLLATVTGGMAPRVDSRTEIVRRDLH